MAKVQRKRIIQRDAWVETPVKRFRWTPGFTVDSKIPSSVAFGSLESQMGKNQLKLKASPVQKLGTTQDQTSKSPWKNRLYSFEDVDKIVVGLWETKKDQICERYDAIVGQTLEDQRENYVRFLYERISQQLEGKIANYLS